ncbi:hypothetical protein DAPPUDRAFT_249418 [Daphnia pulex]|uniref:Peptidase A2 domain-containing protein n=1 Tax=Daphnia pulex TaxID=6669 RepID=E9GWM2_DAPPU|nr:hypothetical protein DAPPUDRAFT_249418 [Daphnia pulex]|eukprot:EFX76159.1 hypothetical protein DAPPUDRAFT_249418 [Daphnia pulex]
MKKASESATRLPYKKENRTTPASGNEKAGPRGTVHPHFRLRSPEVEIRVSEFGGTVKAIVDTGATVSAVKRSGVRDMNLEKSAIEQVKLVDVATVCPLGESKVLVEWGGEKKNITFLVLEEMPYSMILGTDWIRTAALF